MLSHLVLLHQRKNLVHHDRLFFSLELQVSLKVGQNTSMKVVTEALKKIRRVNPGLNAIISGTLKEDVLRRAEGSILNEGPVMNAARCTAY